MKLLVDFRIVHFSNKSYFCLLGGRTNLTRAAATNAQILANRATTNTTYNVNVIEDTQIDNTLIIPDTIANNDTQHNDMFMAK